MQFSASVASSNLMCVREELRRLADWPLIHFDMEDGNFTPNITFGMAMLRGVAREIAPRQLSVHLMMNHPLDVLSELAGQNVAAVSAHIEALPYPLLFLNRAKELGMRAGLAINIQTPLSLLAPFIPALDELLVMTSEPDGAGEKLWPPALAKAVEAARTLPVPVWADGGLKEEAVGELHRAGAAGCVLGRLVFGAADPQAALTGLRERYG